MMTPSSAKKLIFREQSIENKQIPTGSESDEMEWLSPNSQQFQLFDQNDNQQQQEIHQTRRLGFLKPLALLIDGEESIKKSHSSSHHQTQSLNRKLDSIADTQDQTLKPSVLNSFQMDYALLYSDDQMSSKRFNHQIQNEEHQGLVNSNTDLNEIIYDQNKHFAYHCNGDLVMFLAKQNDQVFLLRILQKSLIKQQNLQAVVRHFFHELQQASDLGISPKLFQTTQDEGQFCYLFQYIPDGNILEYLNKHQEQILLKNKIKILQSIIQKIDDMKEKLKIHAHGNLKYQNIIYDSTSETIYLMDFQTTYKNLKQISHNNKQQETKKDIQFMGNLAIVILFGSKALEHTQTKQDLNILLRYHSQKLNNIFEWMIFEPTFDWNQFKNNAATMIQELTTGDDSNLSSQREQSEEQPQQYTTYYQRKKRSDQPRLNLAESPTNRDRFVRPSVLIQKELNSHHHTRFLFLENLMEDQPQISSKSIEKPIKRKSDKCSFIKTFHSRFTHNRIQYEYQVESMESVYVQKEIKPIVNSSLQTYSYDLPIFDVEKIDDFPNTKKPDYDWDIISVIDNTADAVNHSLDQTNRFNDINSGFNLDKYELENLFKILNTDSKSLVLSAFDNNRQRPYTVKLVQWNDDVDYFEFIQELIILRHIQNFSYPKLKIKYLESQDTKIQAQYYLKSLYQEASQIVDLVQTDYDLDLLDEQSTSFPAHLISAVIKVQCLKQNGVLQLIDNYVVKKGSTRVLVMVMDYFDFTLKDYLIQFYREDIQAKIQKPEYKPIITFDDQLHLMFGVSKVATSLEKLGIYFNNYCPENIVFARGRVDKSQPKLMLFNFNKCMFKQVSVQNSPISTSGLFTIFEIENDQLKEQNQSYKFFRHSTNLKYCPPEVTAKIDSSKTQTITVKVDPSKKDSYSLGVLYLEIFLKRLVHFNEVSYQALQLDPNNIICVAITKLLEEKPKLRWTLKEFEQYVKFQRQQLCNFSVLLRGNSIIQMWTMIEEFENKRDEFMQLTLRDLKIVAMAKSYRFLGQIRLCKEKLSLLKVKYIQNNFKAQESWKTELSLIREIAYFYRDDNNYKLSFEFHEKLFELYKKYVYPNVLDLVDVIFSFGMVKYQLGQYSAAAGLYDQCISNIRKYYDNDVGQPYLVRITIQQGLLQQKLHDIAKALNHLEQASIIASSTFHLISPLCAQQLATFSEIKSSMKAQLYGQGSMNDIIQISPKINQQLLTISLCTQGMHGPTMFEVLKYQGQCFYQQGKYDQAIQQFIKAAKFSKDVILDLVKETWDDLLQYTTLTLVGREGLQAEIDKSVEQVYSQKLNYLHPGLTQIFNGIGECYRVLQQNVVSLIWYEKALKCLALDNIDHADVFIHCHEQPFYFDTEKMYVESQIYNNIGISYKNLHLYSKSIESYQESIKLKVFIHYQQKQQVFGKNTDKIAEPLFNIANLQLKAGQFDESIALYDEVLNILSANTETAFYAEVLQNKGLACFQQNNIQKAMQLLKVSLAISKQVVGNQSLPVAETLSNMGLILLSQCQYRKAHAYFDEASRYFQKQLPEDHPHRKSLEQNLIKCTVNKR